MSERSDADEPDLPPPPQLGVRRQPPSRRTAITRAAIVDAAFEVLDAGGVERFTMRRVAERLGTGVASLYAHVAGKDQLLELIYDELVGRVALPEADAEHWEEQLRQLMRDFRTVLVTHRDAALAGLGRIPTTPRVLRAAESLTAVMRAGGLSNRVIALGLDQLVLHVSATALEESIYAHSGMDAPDLASYFAEVHAFYQALPPQRFPVLASLASDMTGPDADERFEFGLGLLIEGLKAADDDSPAGPAGARGGRVAPRGS